MGLTRGIQLESAPNPHSPVYHLTPLMGEQHIWERVASGVDMMVCHLYPSISNYIYLYLSIYLFISLSVGLCLGTIAWSATPTTYLLPPLSVSPRLIRQWSKSFDAVLESSGVSARLSVCRVGALILSSVQCAARVHVVVPATGLSPPTCTGLAG